MTRRIFAAAKFVFTNFVVRTLVIDVAFDNTQSTFYKFEVCTFSTVLHKLVLKCFLN